MSNVEEFIEFVLMHPGEITSALQDKRRDAHNGHTGGNGTGHSFVSDPTAAQAIRDASPVMYVFVPYGPVICGKREQRLIKRPEMWLRVVKDVSEYYLAKDDTKEFYRRRYSMLEPWRSTCKTLHISTSTYYALNADILKMAENIAIGYGLLSPYWRMKKD